jgi:hypothetical protein
MSCQNRYESPVKLRYESPVKPRYESPAKINTKALLNLQYESPVEKNMTGLSGYESPGNSSLRVDISPTAVLLGGKKHKIYLLMIIFFPFLG